MAGNSSEKLIVLMHNGAANLSGSRNGVQARFKNHYNFAHSIHSCNQKLNLVFQKSCFQNNSVRLFFNNLSGISLFFSSVPQRMAVLDVVAHRRISQSSAT